MCPKTRSDVFGYHHLMPSPEDTILKAVRDADRGRRNLAALATHLGALAPDLFAPLGRLLPRTADPDMALNNLERLFAQPGRPRPTAGAARRPRPRTRRHPPTARHLAVLRRHARRRTRTSSTGVFHVPRRNPSTAELIAQLRGEVEAAGDDAGVLRAFRRFRHRHTLRIGINDVIRDRPLEEITRELARLADASIEVALEHALRKIGEKFGAPTTPDGQPAPVAALAFGKLGGDELNYSSDIDLMFVYDADGETAGAPRGRDRTPSSSPASSSEVVRLLSSHTDRGFAYRVDLRLRPEGNRGPLARSRSPARSATTTRWAARGSGRRSSSCGPSAGDLGARRASSSRPSSRSSTASTSASPRSTR